MRSVPPADPRGEELQPSGGQTPPPGPRPATCRNKTSRVSAAAVLLTLVALAIIAVIVLV